MVSFEVEDRAVGSRRIVLARTLGCKRLQVGEAALCYTQVAAVSCDCRETLRACAHGLTQRKGE
jgi:hypothetical protein